MNCLKRSDFVDISKEGKVKEYSLLPYLNTDSPASNIHPITNIDTDVNMPLDNNFAYFTTHDFHNNYDISQCFSNNQSFSLLNCNIRSLSNTFIILQICCQICISLSH